MNTAFQSLFYLRSSCLHQILGSLEVSQGHPWSGMQTVSGPGSCQSGFPLIAPMSGQFIFHGALLVCKLEGKSRQNSTMLKAIKVCTEGYSGSDYIIYSHGARGRRELGGSKALETMG